MAMGRIAEALKRAQRERGQYVAGQAQEAGAAVRPFDSGGGAMSGTEAAGTGARPGSIFDAMVLPNLPPLQGPRLDAGCVPNDVIMLHDPGSEIAEKYRSVRTRLLTSNPSGTARTYAITSSQPKEGKTVTTANMGFSLAELSHRRVALVDLDFRRRGLTSLFGTQERPGIADVLRGEKRLSDVALRLVRENLFFIPSGDPAGAGLADLLSGTHVNALFREMNDRFHGTLIDTAPVNTASDIGSIAPLCHAVVMVIRMNRTPEPLLKRSIRLLKANHVNIAGCILAGYDEATMGYTDPHDYYEQEV